MHDDYAMKKISYLIDSNLVLISSRSGFPFRISLDLGSHLESHYMHLYNKWPGRNGYIKAIQFVNITSQDITACLNW